MSLSSDAWIALLSFLSAVLLAANQMLMLTPEVKTFLNFAVIVIDLALFYFFKFKKPIATALLTDPNTLTGAGNGAQAEK